MAVIRSSLVCRLIRHCSLRMSLLSWRRGASMLDHLSELGTVGGGGTWWAASTLASGEVAVGDGVGT